MKLMRKISEFSVYKKNLKYMKYSLELFLKVLCGMAFKPHYKK